MLSLKEKHSIPVGKVLKFISQSLETEVAADCGNVKPMFFLWRFINCKDKGQHRQQPRSERAVVLTALLL